MDIYRHAGTRNDYTSKPDGIITPVVSNSEIANWLVLDSSDPTLSGLALMATAHVINFLQLELVNRSRVLTYQDWPYIGTEQHPSLSRPDAYFKREIELPYANLNEITDVMVYGEPETDYTIIRATTDRLYFNQIPTRSSITAPALVVEYIAGFGDSVDDVPDPIRQGVLMLGAFLYEHKGACDAMEAMKRSGAESLLYPYKAKAVVL
jgi:hypothetical protein